MAFVRKRNGISCSLWNLFYYGLHTSSEVFFWAAFDWLRDNLEIYRRSFNPTLLFISITKKNWFEFVVWNEHKKNMFFTIDDLFCSVRCMFQSIPMDFILRDLFEWCLICVCFDFAIRNEDKNIKTYQTLFCFQIRLRFYSTVRSFCQSE